MKPEVDRRREAIDQLGRRHRIRRLELFGSAATGDDRPRESDLYFRQSVDQTRTLLYAS